jgi:thiamine-phosphate pyrophosphorylase
MIDISLHGLYVITDSQLIPAPRFLDIVEQAIEGGANVVQYRDKHQTKTQCLKQASALQSLCQQYHVPLIINDDIALAKQVDAAGVHLGKEDADLISAREQLGSDVWIGISCYNQVETALQAVSNGADYVAFGSFFPSTTKPQAILADIQVLQQARRQLPMTPIIAIGGITPQNGDQLIEAGADCLAIIQGVFGQEDVRAAAQRYAQLFVHS